MKFSGSSFGLLFLTSSELEPEDMLKETSFVCKMTAIFAPWDEALASTEIPDKESFAAACTNTEMCNLCVKNLEGINLI